MQQQAAANPRKHGTLTVKPFTCNPFSTTCYVVHDGREAVVVDASPSHASEVEELVSYVEAHNLRVVRALLTHAHIDHIFGCRALADKFDVIWELHPADMPLYQQASQQAAMFGVPFTGAPDVNATLDEIDTLEILGTTWAVRHTPGHSPGSVTFVDEANGFALVGDVLFNGSVGRTDLWEGSFPTLRASIARELMVLDNETVVYCGHGPHTTIGHERDTNPFLRD